MGLLNCGRHQHHVAPCISLTPSSTVMENSYLAVKARESINSAQATHSKIINQPVRAPTTQSFVVYFDGVTERKKFAVNLVREMSRHSTRWRKYHQCLRVRTPCLHSNINEFLSEPSAIMTHTQPRHSMSENDEALFEHWHKGTPPFGNKSHS